MRALTCQSSGRVFLSGQNCQAGGSPPAHSWRYLQISFSSDSFSPSTCFEQLPQLHVVGAVGTCNDNPVLHWGGDRGLREDGAEGTYDCLAVMEGFPEWVEGSQASRLTTFLLLSLCFSNLVALIVFVKGPCAVREQGSFPRGLWPSGLRLWAFTCHLRAQLFLTQPLLLWSLRPEYRRHWGNNKNC